MIKSILTLDERKALSELAASNDIIISNADKGGAAVIQDVKDYIKEAETQFNNNQYYKKLNTPPTNTHRKTSSRSSNRPL